MLLTPIVRKYLGKFYTDALVHDEDALKYLVSTMGLDKVMLGSDYPFPLGEHHPGKLVDSILDWDQDTKVTNQDCPGGREGVVILALYVTIIYLF